MSKILFVFEGEKTEGKIANNFAKHFLDNNTVIHCAFCSNIYKLYKELDSDEFLDLFSVLKEMDVNKVHLEPFNRDSFAEIYLFFDYDGHSTAANDEKLKELVELFDEETDHGKIYISYPMVESLKHYSENIDFKNLTVEAKKNIKYKQLSNRECDKQLIDFNKYTKEIWLMLIEIHLKKMNHITTGDYSLPSDSFTQEDIFENQLEKYIKPNETVAVLNSFPIFLYEYFGSKILENFK